MSEKLIPVSDDDAFGDGAGRRTRGRRIKAGLLEVVRVNGRVYATETSRRKYIENLLASGHSKLGLGVGRSNPIAAADS